MWICTLNGGSSKCLTEIAHAQQTAGCGGCPAVHDKSKECKSSHTPKTAAKRQKILNAMDGHPAGDSHLSNERRA